MKIFFFQLKQKSGQAVVEMVIGLPLVAVCLMVTLLFFQLQAQRLWLDYQLYQSLICLARGETKIHCKRNLHKQSKYFLWMGRLTDVHLYKGGQNQWTGTLTWKGLYWNLHFKKNLNLDSLLQLF